MRCKIKAGGGSNHLALALELPLSSDTLLSPNHPSKLGQKPEETVKRQDGDRGQSFSFIDYCQMTLGLV